MRWTNCFIGSCGMGCGNARIAGPTCVTRRRPVTCACPRNATSDTPPTILPRSVGTKNFFVLAADRFVHHVRADGHTLLYLLLLDLFLTTGETSGGSSSAFFFAGAIIRKCHRKEGSWRARPHSAALVRTPRREFSRESGFGRPSVAPRNPRNRVKKSNRRSNQVETAILGGI